MARTTARRHHEPAAATPPTRLWHSPAAWIVTLLTAGLCAALALDVTPLLRGPAPYPQEWQWGLAAVPDLRPVWLALPVAAALAIGAWAWLVACRSHLQSRALLVLAVLALAFRLAVQMTSQDGLSIVARTLNPAYFGYFPPASRVSDLGEFLRTYPERRMEYNIRVQTHPPGNVIFYWLFIRAFESVPSVTQALAPVIEPHVLARPDWAQRYTTAEVLAGAAASLAVPAISTLGVLPLHRLAGRLGSPRAARLAVVLYAFIPALVLFTPVVDDLFSFLTVTALWLTVKGLDERRATWVGLAGLAWGVEAFMTFGVLPVLLLLALTIALRRVGEAGGGRRALLEGVALGAGGSAVWGLAWLLTGLNPVALYRVSTLAHGGLTETRSYWLWLVYNPYDVLLFAGVPAAVHFLRGATRVVGRSRGFPRLPSPADQLMLAFLITMAALLVSGMVRGETARILLYTTPVLAWAAGCDIAEHEENTPGYGAWMAALMAGQAIFFYVILDVYH